ncbi:MAG: isopentenyl phosphate kinase [Chloroflexi bacterium]|nr:isopentenyl phosphate kinase [Chloroflexota bacterium]
MKKIVFLKLGGSVITNKDRADTADLDHIDSISKAIRRALSEDPDLALVIGHGSGSFGHHAAKIYNTQNGVHNSQEWQGFTQVSRRARALNQIVIERLQHAKLEVISISPLSSIITKNRTIIKWNIFPIRESLKKGIIPVIYGDVVFDQEIGGTILSTEELFENLALKLHPQSILLAGLEAGVWKDFPLKNEFVSTITPENYTQFEKEIYSSTSTDVTGGMRSKVKHMISLINHQPELEIQIFSALKPENVYLTLMGQEMGTMITSSERKRR